MKIRNKVLFTGLVLGAVLLGCGRATDKAEPPAEVDKPPPPATQDAPTPTVAAAQSVDGYYIQQYNFKLTPEDVTSLETLAGRFNPDGVIMRMETECMHPGGNHAVYIKFASTRPPGALARHKVLQCLYIPHLDSPSSFGTNKISGNWGACVPTGGNLTAREVSLTAVAGLTDQTFTADSDIADETLVSILRFMMGQFQDKETVISIRLADSHRQDKTAEYTVMTSTVSSGGRIIEIKRSSQGWVILNSGNWIS